MVVNASRLDLPHVGTVQGMFDGTRALAPVKLVLCGAPGSGKAASTCSKRDMYGGQVLRLGSSSRTLAGILLSGRRTRAAHQARCFGAHKRFGNEEFHIENDLKGPKIENSSWVRTVPNLTASCLCIDRPILKGEIVEHSGVIIVKGNVNSGAAIHADGDIIILGHLKGEAHAGRSGDIHAIVFALHLKPTTISIAGSVAHGLSTAEANFGQVASLFSDGEIRIEKALDQSFKYPPVEKEDINAVKEQTVGVLKGGDKAWFGIDINSMRKPSRVAFFTGSYIFVIGIALFLFPEPLFGLFFDLKSVTQEWIRVGAVLAVVFGVYYIGTALGDVKGCNGADSFYMSTVIGRLVGAVNLIGALAMLKALRSQTIPRTTT